MMLDARELDPGTTLKADVAIAGAGAAGITLARDLDRQGLDVLLLEGGGLEYDESQQELFRGEGNYPQPLERVRLRRLGGTTGHWSGLCRPLDPETFEPRPWVRNSGWPIVLDDLVPYYRRAHETLELGAFDYSAAGLAGLLKMPLLPTSLLESTVFRISAPPVRFGTKYRDEITRSRRVRAVLHASLVGVRLAPGGRAVSHLALRTPEARELRAHARVFVLALGGFENARLLLASNDVARGGVGNGHDVVGRYFLDHPHYVHAAFLFTNVPLGSFYLFHNPVEGGRAWVWGAFRLPAELCRGREVAGAGFTVMVQERSSWEQIAGSGGLQPEDVAALAGDLAPRRPALALTFRLEQEPDPESRLSLAAAKDALGLPRVEVRWKTGETDRRTARAVTEAAALEAGRLGLGRLWIHEAAFRSELPPEGGPHPMGTTRMSSDPRKGVVNGDGRIHSVENLYVTGSSVFPTGGISNPTLTIVALAHRLAEHLGGRLR